MTTTPAPTTGGTPTPDTLKHGRHGTYTWYGCRCPKCTAAATRYSANRRRQKAYGRWQPLVDAGRVRAHLDTLRAAGLTTRQISDRSSVHAIVIENLGRNRTQRVRPANADAILAIQPPAHVYSLAPVDATATRRRLQALTALGWPLTRITTTAGVHPRSIRDVLHGRQAAVAASTAAAIHAAYGQLWDRDPAMHGVLPRLIRGAQALAASRQWAPPLAWDDDSINDPTALPDWTGRCGTTGGYYDHTQIGSPTCPRCREAVRVAAADRKFRRRQRQAA
ncbi:hypothetical protein [Kitasatospora camelliae]|uniref:Uncharacterized protein n=1 Tax=Kitasatospora camelliae TaxID=3156397 RepID=A0AAU8K4N8_9ACTN